MQTHVKVLGWLQIAMGFIDLVIGLGMFGLLSGIGALTGEIQAFGIMSIIGGAIGTFMIVMAIPNFICGIGLLRNWGGWVIVLAVILGFINLLHVPIGTAIALYTFWVAWKLYNARSATTA